MFCECNRIAHTGKIERLGGHSNQFDLILASGIWHHLDREKQYLSIQRIAQLLNLDGVLLLTLRNGPAGVGLHVFPTNGKQTIKEAEHCGLSTLLFLENQPSLMENKEKVFWTKLVFKKIRIF
jgi:SAM-dependent methyltransferase